MEGSGFRAATVSWDGYYRAIEGRSLRPLFLDAIARLPGPDEAGQARVAIDLGCGDGSETLALLERGWTVTAVDAAPEAIERLHASVQPGDVTRLTTKVAPFPDATITKSGATQRWRS